MNISVFGTGYVGLVTGVCFAEHGHHVICADIDQKKIAALLEGRSPIYEPGLEALIAKNIESGHLNFTTDLKKAVHDSEILFIAVGTPSDHDGSADLKYVFNVAGFIGENLTEPKLVVNKSTVPVGTCERVQSLLTETLKNRHMSFTTEVCSNPEFLREGTAVMDCLKPSRVVIGVSSEAASKRLLELYSTFVENSAQIITMDPPSAELSKYAANTMLAARISFMNELSQICEKVGANIENIRRGIGTDHRIGTHFLNAGVGYGGSCFPKDVRALSRTGKQLGLDLKMLSAIAETNTFQKNRFFERIKESFGGNLAGHHLTLWGLAFKPGTDDLREAPALDLIDLLCQAGAHVNVFDPIANEKFKTYLATRPDLRNIRILSNVYDSLVDAEALCIVTEWPEFKNIDLKKVAQLMKQPLIFDGRNIFSLQNMENLPFEYHSIGRPTIRN